MRQWKRMLAMALPVLALALGACDDSATGNGEGSFTLLLTDAPGDFDKAVVTIERIELIGDASDEVGGALLLRDEPWSGNLLELQNEVATLIENAPVAAGTYQQLRLIISGGCIEVETETGSDIFASTGYAACGPADGSLVMPSFEETGLKIDLPGGGIQITSSQKIVLLDFVVSESFGQQAGMSGSWVMHPVIRATEMQFSGSLTVDVALAAGVTLPGATTLADFQVQLDDEAPVALVDGSASFQYLVPGTYSVDLIAPEGVAVTTDVALPASVDIASGADATLALVVTSAE
ncbi:MAG TPA: DUF4382 domain-containing protein [Longimicrobiales bacterium]|nr:DUF4382 domain-containing protein [Longimicrobiales bacterium]